MTSKTEAQDPEQHALIQARLAYEALLADDLSPLVTPDAVSAALGHLAFVIVALGERA
jgi:hypothetical protein